MWIHTIIAWRFTIRLNSITSPPLSKNVDYGNFKGKLKELRDAICYSNREDTNSDEGSNSDSNSNSDSGNPQQDDLGKHDTRRNSLKTIIMKALKKYLHSHKVKEGLRLTMKISPRIRA